MATWVVVTATGADPDSPEWRSEVVEAVTREAAMVQAGARMAVTIPVISVTVRRVPPVRRYDIRAEYKAPEAKPKPFKQYRGPAVIPVKRPVI